MRLKDDALVGLANKKKRDRLVLDLLGHPDVMNELDPANLVGFEEYLEMRSRDQIGVNDVAAIIYLHRGQTDRAIEVANQSTRLAELTQDPFYGQFAKMVLAVAGSRGFSFVEEVFRDTQTEIVYYHGETLLVA